MLRALLLLLTAVTLSAEPRRVIVEFAAPPLRAGVRADGQLENADRLAGDLAHRPGVAARIRHRMQRALNGAVVELPPDGSAAEIARLPYVARVTPDAEFRAFAGAGSSRRAAAIRSNASGGSGVVVAVIDSGIDASHPALAGKVIGGWDFVNDDADPSDDNRHGTHVAGIIAAQSAQVTGVAPGVSLLAYKVLDARGKGMMSDILAAIERSLDPDGDGNPADRAGVINLSLGGVGHPGDPVSRAVENAVAAGVVVCVAAGNDGMFHAIGSPGAAPSAITVGAFDDGNETLAEFSNRGPSTGNAAVKPEVVAPGTNILSTVPGGNYLRLSGTSMATPWVAGLAALIRSAHPDWPPSRVKSAIVGSGIPLLDHEVMAQGSGLARREVAVVNDLEVQPATVSLGLDPTSAPAWHAERTITVTNHSASEKTVAVTAAGSPPGVTVAVVPPSLTLAAGAAGEVRLSVDADHAKLGEPPSPSLSFGGRILLQFEEGERWIPWAFVRAARATVTWAGETPQVMWNIPESKYASHASIGSEGMETLVEPGTFDFALVAAEADGLRVVVAEEQEIAGDRLFSFSDADTPHEVRLEAIPGATGSSTLHSVLARLIQPGGSISLPTGHRVIRSSSFGDRYSLLATEALVDTEWNRVYVAQHPPLRGLSGDVTLGVPAGGFAMQDVVLHARPGATTQEITVMPRDWPRRSSEFGPQPPSISATVAGDWVGTLYSTAETHSDFASGVQFQTRGEPGEGPAWMSTPMVRRTAGGFASFRGFEDPSVPAGVVGSEDLEFGGAAVHPAAALVAGPNGITGSLELRGDRGETRRAETATVEYRVRTSDGGQQVNSGTLSGGTTFVSLPGPGAYVAELKSDAIAFRDATAVGTLTLGFDTRTGSVDLPSITSLAVLDGAGRHVSRLPHEGNGSVVFSATGATTVGSFFRPLGKTTWVQATPVHTGDDPENGAIYRVDLADALRFAGGVELLVELISPAGATAQWHLAPAFVSEPAPERRRRSVRH